MDDDGNVGGVQPGIGKDLPHPVHHPLFRRGWRGQHLDGGATAGVFEGEVGEGAANIDG